MPRDPYGYWEHKKRREKQLKARPKEGHIKPGKNIFVFMTFNMIH